MRECQPSFPSHYLVITTADIKWHEGDETKDERMSVHETEESDPDPQHGKLHLPTDYISLTQLPWRLVGIQSIEPGDAGPTLVSSAPS